MTSRFQSEYSTNLSYTLNNGDKGTRTLDPLLVYLESRRDDFVFSFE